VGIREGERKDWRGENKEGQGTGKEKGEAGDKRMEVRQFRQFFSVRRIV